MIRFAHCCVALAMFIVAGCAVTRESGVTHWQSCDGRAQSAWVQVRQSSFPPVDCAAAWIDAGASVASVALLTALLPLGCAVPYSGDRWVIVVPLLDIGGLVEKHEMQHVRGERHWIADEITAPC